MEVPELGHSDVPVWMPQLQPPATAVTASRVAKRWPSAITALFTGILGLLIMAVLGAAAWFQLSTRLVGSVADAPASASELTFLPAAAEQCTTA